MFRKIQFSISREGWYYLFVLTFIVSGALLREINLLLVLTGMMIGPFLFNWWAVTTTLHRLRLERSLPDRIGAGDLLIVELALTNGRARLGSWTVVVEDRIHRLESSKGDGIKHVCVMAPRVRPGETTRLGYRGRLLERGHYEFGPVRVSTRFPLGLLWRAIQFKSVDLLVVYPRLGQLTLGWAQLVQTRRVGSRHSRHRHGLVEGDFYGLRDWRSGDSRRWIHWRTSAKRGSLKIRQFEQQRSQEVTLLVDLWQPAHASSEQIEVIELAVAFAATAVEDMCRRGSSQILLGLSGDRLRWISGAASMGLLYEAMDLLAGAKGDNHDHLPELIERALERITPGMKAIILSTRPTDLNDTNRFGKVWDDPHKRNALGRIDCIDVGGEEVGKFFR